MVQLVGIDVQQSPTGLVHESVRWEVISDELALLGIPTAIAALYLDGLRAKLPAIPPAVIASWADDLASRVEPDAFLSSAATGIEWAALRRIGPALRERFPRAALWTFGPHAADLSEGPEWRRLEPAPFAHVARVYGGAGRPVTGAGAAYRRALFSSFGAPHVLGATWASSGCPYGCSFCLPDNTPALGRGRRWRARAGEELLRDVSERRDLGCRFVRLIDLNVTGGGLERFLSLAETLSRRFPEVQFWCDGSAEILLGGSPEQLARVPRAGWTVQLGIETFDPASRARLDRPPLPDGALRRLLALPDDTAVRLSVMSFFPWTKPAEVAALLDVVEARPDVFPPDTLFRRLRLYAGLPISRRLIAERAALPIDPPERQYYPEESEKWLPDYFFDRETAERAPAWFEASRELLETMRRVRGYRRRAASSGPRTALLLESARRLAEAFGLASRGAPGVELPGAPVPEAPPIPVFESAPFVCLLAMER